MGFNDGSSDMESGGCDELVVEGKELAASRVDVRQESKVPPLVVDGADCDKGLERQQGEYHEQQLIGEVCCACHGYAMLRRGSDRKRGRRMIALTGRVVDKRKVVGWVYISETVIPKNDFASRGKVGRTDGKLWQAVGSM